MELVNDLAKHRRPKVIRGSCMENEQADSELIKKSIGVDSLIKMECFTKVPENPINWELENYDFACFDVLLDKNKKSITEAVRAKEGSPSTVVGFITHVPESRFSRIDEVDFIISKLVASESDYIRLLPNIILVNKLSNIILSINNYLIDNISAKENLETKVVDLIQKMISLSKYKDVLFAFNNIDKSLTSLWDIITSRNDPRADSIVRTIVNILKMQRKCIYKGLYSIESLYFLRDNSNIITSRRDFIFEEPKMIPMSEVLERIQNIEFGLDQTKDLAINFAIEITFTLVKPITVNNLLDSYINFYMPHPEIQFPISIFKHQFNTPHLENTVPIAIYPSGSIELFGKIEIENDNFVIKEPNLECYFDPGVEGNEDMIKNDVVNTFWISLAEL